MSEGLREAVLVFFHELGRTLRGAKGILLFLLYLSGAFIGALIFVSIVGATVRFTEEVGSDAAMQVKQGVFNWLFHDDPETAKHLTGEPLIPLFCFWGARAFLPFAILFLGFDAVSGEAGARTLRFTTLRCRRGSLLAGKLGSQLVLAAALSLLSFGLVEAYATLRLGVPELKELFALARYWALTLPFIATAVAVVGFASTLVRTPIVALLLGAVVFIGLWALRVIVGGFVEPARWLTPAQYEPMLLSPEVSVWAVGAAAGLGFAAVFATASWLVFRKRDL